MHKMGDVVPSGWEEADRPSGDWVTEMGIVINRLSCGRFCKESVDKRINAAIKHVSCYLEIIDPYIPSGPPFKYERIEFIIGYLNVIDGKVGHLLQFQAFVLTAISILLGSFWTQIRAIDSFPGHLMVATLWVAYVCCCLATLLCLWAVRTAAWGNLEQDKGPQKAEEEHSRFLILEVIKRTAKFRVAVPLTVLGVIIFMLLLPILLYSLPNGKAPNGNGIQPSHPVRIADVGPFPLGVGCNTSDRMERQLSEATDAIQDLSVRKVQVVGSADAVPIGVSLAEAYGNNTGLALSRARCVAGWLTQSLTTRGIRLEMVIAVRDAIARSRHDRQFGNGEDRQVTVYWLPDGTPPQ